MPISAPAQASTALTDETLAKLDQNTSEVQNLSLQDKYALADRLMAGEPAPSSPEEVKPPAEEKPAAPGEEKPTETKPVEETPQAEIRKDRKYWKDKSQREADEKNTYKQKLEAAERRLKALEQSEAEVKAVKADKPLDPYDPEQMKAMADEFAQIKKKLEIYESSQKSSVAQEVDETKKILAKTEEESVFTAIGRLQAEYADLQTERPFEKENADYAAWLNKISELSGLKASNPDAKPQELQAMARELYKEDEDFRRECIAKKAKPPKDLDKIETILTLHEKKTRDGGGYRANYLEMLEESGVLPTVIAQRERDASLKGANAAVEAMTRGSRSATTLTPTDGSSQFPSASAPEKMKAFLQDLGTRVRNGHRMSADEKRMAMEYTELLSGGT